MDNNNDLKNIDPTPFQILGIEPTMNKAEVTCAYRRMLLLIHPDKVDKRSKINWSAQERNEAFNRIRKAYKTIIKEYTFNDAPDYDIEYQDIEKENNDISITYMNDMNKFNEAFEHQKKQLEQAGAYGPENIGYSEFNRTITDSKKLKKKLKKVYAPNSNPNNKKKQELVTYTPHQAPEQKNYYEYGLTEISDYGFGGFGKNSLAGSDLSQVFEDRETWEKSAYKLKDKYNDNTNITDKLKTYKYDRSNLNIDNEYAKAQEYETKIRQEQMDYNNRIRMIQNERDNIFSINSNLLKY